MDHSNTYSKLSNTSSLTPINNNERASTVTYGEGYVYTGPLTSQNYEIQSKSTSETSKHPISQSDGQDLNFPSSPSITNLSLSSSPSTEVVHRNTTDQYQFKVMLLGDSGVGKLWVFIDLLAK